MRRQCGFRCGLSTNLPMIAINDSIKLEIDQGRSVVGHFSWISLKSLTIINYDILFSKLPV